MDNWTLKESRVFEIAKLAKWQLAEIMNEWLVP